MNKDHSLREVVAKRARVSNQLWFHGIQAQVNERQFIGQIDQVDPSPCPCTKEEHAHLQRV